MQPETRQQLKNFVANFVRRKIRPLQNVSIEQLRRAFPFHDLFFRDEALLAFKLQRSIVTSLGRGFYSQIAQIISSDMYTKSIREHTIDCILPSNMCDAIEHIVTSLRVGLRKPAHAVEVNEVLNATGGDLQRVPVTADLYLEGGPTGPVFIELKSPKPNLDVCAESKRKMLYFVAHAHQNSIQDARAVFALYYNPYFPEHYHWPFTKQIMDMETEVFIGGEFWNFLGGPGTYDELLRILAEVKQELRLQ